MVLSAFSSAFVAGRKSRCVPATSVGAWKYTSQQMSALARALTTMMAATVAPVDPPGFIIPLFSNVACILRPSSKSLSPGVEHECGEQQGQIDHAYLEQIAGVHLGLYD